jgi:Zn-dependent protease/CBS domain-containing protein
MFGGSITLFRVGETHVRLHSTFFLLLAFFAVAGWLRGGPTAAFESVAFVSLLFVCVLLHEFGHVLAARRYGIVTRDITLLPIGGLASLESMPRKPFQEIVIALAGPAVNVVIAALLLLLLALQGGAIDVQQAAELERSRSGMVMQLAAANVMLVLFNLIPAFPMDGGRVLRAVLAISMGYVRATQLASRIGQGLAVVLGFLGLFGNPLLILVAVFVFLAATGEAGAVRARDLTRGRLVRDAMITSFASLGPQSSVGAAADLLLRTTQHEFPVLDGGGHLRGAVTREAIVDALQQKGEQVPVLEIMDANVPTLPANACLETWFDRMQREGMRFIGVLDSDKRLIGYLTPENIAELVMIGTARAAAASAAPQGV